MKPLVGHGEGVEIVEHPYGDQVVWLQAHSGKNFAARFWVKRPAGWRLRPHRVYGDTRLEIAELG